MKRLFGIICGLIIILTILPPVFAENKSFPSNIIPKLSKTANDPQLFNGHVYPFWGPVCQRYTYSVIYQDKEGRAPTYVQIYFNGKMIDLEPAFVPLRGTTASEEDYKKGVKYIYKFVPNRLGSNFYYFEASNGLGKTRESIIDSPDNGPVLFESAFDKNEIALIDKKSGKKIGSFPTGKEWIGGIALSDDGKYLTAKASRHIYLFDTSDMQKPLWTFNCEECEMIGGDVKGGIDISADGKKLIAAIGNFVLLFDNKSSNPVWKYDMGGNAYNVAISSDGKYMAAATAGEEENLNSNLLILWNEKDKKPLWQYHSSGNFHDVSLSADGSFITGSTGCPDRRVYLFSKDSNNPLIKSGVLTRDSPVHRAKISTDGSFFAVGSESDAGAVFLFSKDSNKPIWKFPTNGGSSVRALNFTPDGKYIGAATFGGDAYIFSKESSYPIASWKVNAAFGGIDIADDGSFIVAGGTDNKVHIFDRKSGNSQEISFNEYVEEIDIAKDGRLIAAGTGGSVYFFESFSKDEGKIFPCTQTIEPEPESLMMQERNITPPAKPSGFMEKIIAFFKKIFFRIKSGPPSQDRQSESDIDEKGTCGNDLCEPSLGETRENCPTDCSGSD